MKKSSLIVLLSVVIVDLISKYLVLSGTIRVEYFKNPGLPFVGKVLPGFFDTGLILLSLFVFVWLYKNFFSSSHQIGFALIVGGAVSNLIDRVYNQGVIDFLDLGLSGKFNLADVAIWGGIVILGYSIVKEGYKFRAKKNDK